MQWFLIDVRGDLTSLFRFPFSWLIRPLLFPVEHRVLFSYCDGFEGLPHTGISFAGANNWNLECRNVPIMYGLYMVVKKRSFPGFFASTAHHLCVFIVPFSQTPGRFSDICDSFTGYTLVVFVSAGDPVHYFAGFAVDLAACTTKIAPWFLATFLFEGIWFYFDFN